jgi:hypothetical protein
VDLFRDLTEGRPGGIVPQVGGGGKGGLAGWRVLG